MFLSLFLQVQQIFLAKCISHTSILYEEMFVFRSISSLGFEKLLRSATPRLRISCLVLIPAHAWTEQALCCDVLFIMEYVSIKHDCKNGISIGMDRSLYINLDDALGWCPDYFKLEENKIPSSLVHLCLAINFL